MSADNGIYIAQFSDGWRVIHAQAIENLDYFEPGSDDEKKEWESYFGNAEVFSTEHEAVIHAYAMAKEVTSWAPLEYGICLLGRGVDFK